VETTSFPKTSQARKKVDVEIDTLFDIFADKNCHQQFSCGNLEVL
jgi:hypothetical protein